MEKILASSKCDPSLNANPRSNLTWENTFLVLLRLLFKQFPAIDAKSGHTLERARTRNKIVKTINTSSLPAPTG